MTKRGRAIRLNNEGNAFYNMHRLVDAIECYTRAIELDSSIGLVFCNRGQARSMLQRFREAIEDFEEATRLDANIWKAYVRAARCCVRLGKYEEALRFLCDCRSACPHIQEAVSNFDEKKKVMPAWDQYRLAESLYNENRYESCVKELVSLEMNKVTTHCTALHILMVKAQFKRQRFREVLETIKKLRGWDMTDDERHELTLYDMRATAERLREQWGPGGGARKPCCSDLYEALMLKPREGSATISEITEAYSNLAIRYYPDRSVMREHPQRWLEYSTNDHLEWVKARFLDVTEAFVVLSDPTLRELYKVEEVMDETWFDPAAVWLGVGPHRKGCWRNAVRSVVNGVVVASVCVGGVVTCLVWVPIYLHYRSKSEDESRDYEICGFRPAELAQTWLQRKRKAMLAAGKALGARRGSRNNNIERRSGSTRGKRRSRRGEAKEDHDGAEPELDETTPDGDRADGVLV